MGCEMARDGLEARTGLEDSKLERDDGRVLWLDRLVCARSKSRGGSSQDARVWLSMAELDEGGGVKKGSSAAEALG